MLFFIRSDVSNLVNIGLAGRETGGFGRLDECDNEFDSVTIVELNKFDVFFPDMLVISTVMTAADPFMNDISLCNLLITLAQARFGQC